MTATLTAPAAGERNARFARLFEAHYDYVYRSLRRLGVHTRDIEDVAHELFMSVHQKLDTFDPARAAEPWLFAFAVRFAADYRKLARHRAKLGDEMTDLAAPASLPDEAAGDAEARGLALRALDGLSDELRSVFILYELDEVPMKEIAASLAIPVNTAYSRLRLARAAFAEACKKIQENGDVP